MNTLIDSATTANLASLATQKDPRAALKAAANEKQSRAAAEDFEAVFLNTMFSQMFTDIDGEGPFGGGGAVGMWRSFLTDEYAKSFAKSGGIGIADHVYSALLEIQEQKAH